MGDFFLNSIGVIVFALVLIVYIALFPCIHNYRGELKTTKLLKNHYKR